MTAEGSFSKLLQDIWPQERDFMERPARFKYVRKLLGPEQAACVFCDANAKPFAPENHKLHHTKHAMVILNKYPYNSGHIMVLPRRHTGDLLDLSSDEYTEVMNLVRVSIEVMKQEYQPAGFNIGLNHGAAAGAGLPAHLHWHVIPRWVGDTNFFPLIAETKVLPETLEQTYNKLRPHFAALENE